MENVSSPRLSRTGRITPFKDLKKVIGSDGPDRAERFEAIFRESLRRIQRHTSTVALEVHRDERRAVELGQLLKDFLDLNYEGIRKILKKYVKRVGGDAAEKLTRQMQAEASAAAAFSTMPAPWHGVVGGDAAENSERRRTTTKFEYEVQTSPVWFATWKDDTLVWQLE